MESEHVWVGLTTFLGGSLFTGVAAYFTVIRNQLTKEDHATLCEDKQEVVKVQFAQTERQFNQIARTLETHGKKLDRIIMSDRKSRQMESANG